MDTDQHMHPLAQKELPVHEVHIYYAHLPTPFDAEQYEFVLDNVEWGRYKNYKVAGKQREFLFGRYFLKRVLSQYLPLEAKDISLALNEHQRPYLPHQELQFNLSHSFGGFAVIVHKNLKVGIDLEPLDRKSKLEDGRHVFGSAELRALALKTGSARQHEFLQRWTMKEAIYKAADQGPGLLFNEFELDIATRNIISVSDLLFPNNWKLGWLHDMPAYILAYAIAAGGDKKLDVQISAWTE